MLPGRLREVLFVAEDGKLALRISQAQRTTVWRGIGGVRLLHDAVGEWRARTDTSSRYAHERLDRHVVELGLAGVEDTYHLMFVRRNPAGRLGANGIDAGERAPPTPSGRVFDWIAIEHDTPLAEVRVLPQYGGSPFVDDWDWQDGWWYPYSTYRPATAEEVAEHERAPQARGEL